jgi:itaconyl-CoA hydratase
MSDLESLRQRAVTRWRGTRFEDFRQGQSFEHHWGRTMTAADSITFTTLTLSYNPLYFNREFALSQGHPDLVINPMLVLLTAIGLSVEDLSEGGAPRARQAAVDPGSRRMAGGFLGIDDCTFARPVYPGDTLRVRSTVSAVRQSASRPGSTIVTWHSECLNQHDQVVADYHRSNMMATGPADQQGQP